MGKHIYIKLACLNNSFSSKQAFYFHKRYKHPNKNKNQKRNMENVTCHICHQVFSNRKTLAPHIQAVHIQKHLYCCKYCPKTFTTNKTRNSHEKRHTGDLDCKLCHKSFNSGTAFTQHMWAHQGIRPYVCTLCPETFVENRSLKKHALNKHGVLIKGGISKEILANFVKDSSEVKMC